MYENHITNPLNTVEKWEERRGLTKSNKGGEAD
jgi:hypothetical protein